MLSSLKLTNFRCFTDHNIDLQQHSVIVGSNNAGKTTIAEALRLVSIVTSRYTTLAYHDVPDWLSVPRRYSGCRPSITGLQIRSDTIFHRYGDPPARIVATFPSVATIDIYIGPEAKLYTIIATASGDIVRNKGQARKLNLPTVAILPQVGPLQRSETLLDPDYVRRSQSSYLAPLHFRNQLLAADTSEWEDFKNIVEDTWPGLQIRDLHHNTESNLLTLEVRDRDFVAEVGVMGHGLQMWMQTMWFLARSSRINTIILDEPDVYMHPDLQRRLIRFLRRRFRQTIVTTHSTEIMTEVDHSSIVLVDRRRANSRRVTTLPGLQALVDRVGSVHNIHLTRMWSARRFLIVEGKDLKLLKLIQDVLFHDSETPFDSLPNMQVHGWGGWNWAIGSRMLLKNAADEAIKVMCIFDSDYHTPDQIKKRKLEAVDKGVWLHVWSRKEIENYFLVPKTIARVIADTAGNRTECPTSQEVADRLQHEANALMENVLDAYAQEFIAENRKGGVPQANRRARELIKVKEAHDSGRLGIVSGKDVFARISDWSQSEFGVSVSAVRVARSMHQDEIPRELYDVVREIEDTDAE